MSRSEWMERMAQRGAQYTLSRSRWPSWALLGAGAMTALHVWRRLHTWNLHSRVVVITGARGLALALARAAGARGATVVFAARDVQVMQRACQDLRERRVPCAYVRLDIRDRSDVHRAIDAVDERFGRIDALINCAGVMQVTPLAHATQEDFDDAWATHVRGPWVLTRTVLPVMRRRGEGRVVNIASIGGLVAIPHMTPYCMSKFGLVGLSDAMRTELHQHNIRVTTVCPGLMRTGSHINASFKGQAAKEAAWFMAANAAPLLSMTADKAADAIIKAMCEGRARLDLGMTTRLARYAQALAPEWTAAVTQLASRFLPNALPGPSDLDGEAVRGPAAVRGGNLDVPLPAAATAPADAVVNELHQNEVQQP